LEILNGEISTGIQGDILERKIQIKKCWQIFYHNIPKKKASPVGGAFSIINDCC